VNSQDLQAQRAAKRAEQATDFDPNGLAAPGQVYGLPYDETSAEVVIFPVPWEVTVSYAAGTAAGPEAMREASAQVDLYDPSVPNAWKMGLWMAPSSEKWAHKSERNRERAEAYLEALAEGLPTARLAKSLDKINTACTAMVDWVYAQTTHYLDQGQLVALLGGDHSTPLGYIRALADRHPGMGILQIDAHMDLRKAYEDFTFSHASIMYNAMQHEGISKLVQVGIRDYCEEELEVMADLGDRISVYFDRDLKQAQFQGATWAQQVEGIVANLPQQVYLSFDIDGLDPKLCPHTGTPVAGGFEVEHILFLVERVLASGRTLIGLDLNEVAPGPEGDWDANVGSRLLYRLCNLLGASNGRI